MKKRIISILFILAFAFSCVTVNADEDLGWSGEMDGNYTPATSSEQQNPTVSSYKTSHKTYYRIGTGLRVSLYKYVNSADSLTNIGTPYVLWEGNPSTFTYNWICGTKRVRYAQQGKAQREVNIFCYDEMTLTDRKDFSKLKNPIDGATGKHGINAISYNIPEIKDKEKLKKFIEQDGILQGGNAKTSVGNNIKAIEKKFNVVENIETNTNSQYYVAVEPVVRYIKYPEDSSFTTSDVLWYKETKCGSNGYGDGETDTLTEDSQKKCPYTDYETECTGTGEEQVCEKVEVTKWRTVYNTPSHIARTRKATNVSVNTNTVRESVNFSSYTRAIIQTQGMKENCNSSDKKNGARECQKKTEIATASNYYIGPSAKTSLATYQRKGTTQYQLLTQNEVSNSSLRSQMKTMGIAFYWLESFITKCSDVCENEKGEKLLQCAEKFCDAQYGDSHSKKECILGDGSGTPTTACNYNYEKITCSDEENPYLDQETETTIHQSQAEAGACDSYDGSIKSCINAVVDDEEQASLEEKVYYNISCYEKGTASFESLENTVITPGQGLDYGINIKRNRECVIYFDYKSWQTDFAAIASTDPYNNYYKNILLAKLDVYNNFLPEQDYDSGDIVIHYYRHYDDGTIEEIPSSKAGTLGKLTGCENGEDMQKVGSIERRCYLVNMKQLESRIRDESTEATAAQFQEIVLNSKQLSNKYKSETNDLIATTIKDKYETLSYYSNPTSFNVYSFANYSANNTGYVKTQINSYIKLSGSETEYKLKYQCLSNNNQASVYDLECQTADCSDNPGLLCKDNTPAKQLYYTNLNATANRDFSDKSFAHLALGEAVIAYDANTKYLDVKDACPYQVGDTANPECIITVESGNEVGDNIYEGEVTFRITVDDSIPSNEITRITVNGEEVTPSEDGNGYLVTIDANPARCSEEEVKVEGLVEMKDAKAGVCEFNYKAINPCFNCEIERVSVKDETGKELNPPAGTNASDSLNLFRLIGKNASTNARYYAAINGSPFYRLSATKRNLFYDIRNVEFQYEEAKDIGEITELNDYYDERKNVQMDKSSNKYYIKVDNKDNSKFTITGKVTDSGKIAYCQKMVGYRCTDLYSSTQTTAIDRYCSINYAEDKAGYQNKEECVAACTAGEPKTCTSLYTVEQKTEIKEYCSKYWSVDTAQYKSASDCVKVCSNSRGKCDLLVGTTGSNGYANILNQCGNRYRDLGFSSASNCATTCCTVLGNCPKGTDYVYRPINTANPFPKSYLDKTLTTDTERIVGGNWFGKEFYINPNLYDFMGSIPDGKIATEPEYVIELDADDIKAIRKDNASYNSSDEDANVYLDYVCINSHVNEHGECEGRYLSEFIRESSFSINFNKILDIE